MVSRRIPQAGIFIGKNRMASCVKAKAAGFQVAILDDGFQHLRLKRDLDIVVYDHQEKIRLRESSSGLKRADIILIKEYPNAHESSEKDRLYPQADVYEYTVHSEGIFEPRGKKSVPPEYFEGQKILAFCGIARPGRFKSLLKKGGIKPAGFLAFSDHCDYPSSVQNKIRRECQKMKAEAVITTEKDIFKVTDLPLFRQVPLYFLRIEPVLKKDFYDNINKFMGGKGG
jgi:tetraacyldisaccharide 4'-kinase